MRFALGILVILLNLADNATTFICLRAPVAGFELSEANPAASWLFGFLGLRTGLVFEMLVTSIAVAFLVATDHVPPRIKLALLIVLAVLPAWAALNNLLVIKATNVPLAWG